MAEKYMSPHLRLHKNQNQDHGGRTAHGAHVEGAKHPGEIKQGPHGGHNSFPPGEHMEGTHGTHPHPTTGHHGIVVMHHGPEGAIHHGGGPEHKYTTHTHTSGGNITVEHHRNEQELHDHMAQAFPTAEGNNEQHDQNADNDSYAGGGSMANMTALGGAE